MLALTGILAATACSHHDLARQMVDSPNAHSRKDRAARATDVNEGIPLAVPVGPPTAVLAVRVREPEPRLRPARGTILLLHGMLDDRHQQDAMAGALVGGGYRTVQVDFRGHGESTGDHITYGVVESRDLAQVITHLQQRGLCHNEVGVLGVSYGAATGILLAAHDPRVKTLIAVAPFATLRESIPHFTKLLLPIPWGFQSEADFAAIMKEAERIASFEIDDANPLAAIAHTRARVLLIHGENDAITLPSSSRRLHAAAPGHSELLIIPGGSHLGLSLDPFGKLHPVARQWFDRHLPADARATTPRP